MEINPGYREYVFNRSPLDDDEEYQSYRKSWSECPVKGVVGKVPLHLDFEITTACNLKCDFCPLQKMRIPPRHQNIRVLDRVLEECVPAGTVACKLNWRGEPTCNPRLSEYLSMAKMKGVKEVMINTNGMILHEGLLKAYMRWLDKIIFSVDSIDSETYQRLRPGGSLEVVEKNIKTLLDYRSEERSWRPIIRVQKIDLPETKDEDFVSYWEEFGVDQVAINSYKEKEVGITPVGAKPCAQLWQRLVIAVNGDIYPCCEGYRFGRLGNAMEDSIGSVWNGTPLNHLREVHSANEQNMLSACRNCMVTRSEKKC